MGLYGGAVADVDWEALEAAGVVTPEDQGRRELIEYLAGRGATTERLIASSDRLEGVGADLLLSTGPYTGAELAERCNLTWEEMAQVLRQAGVVAGEPDEQRFDDADVALWGLLADSARDTFGGASDEMLRVLSASFARIAEAGVASFVQDVEVGLDERGASRLDLAKASSDTAEVGLAVGPLLGALLRHHLWTAISRQRRQSATDASRAMQYAAVGFVDLVGFTPLSRSLAPNDLVSLLNDFDVCAHECITLHGGRVVKHLGDAVMFVSDDASSACRQAERFMEAFADRAGTKPRGGVASGKVLFRHGDYYGPVVNLAARLADQAVPGELLVDDVTAAEAADLRFEPGGRRELKGFDEPVRVLAFVPPDQT